MSDLLPKNTNEASVIPVRFTRLYLTLLITLAILLTLGQLLTQWRLRAVQEELLIIRHAALQRHQSQQLVKQSLQITDAGEQSNFAQNVAELRRLFPVFERYHLQSRAGVIDELGVSVANSDTVQQLYRGISPEFDALRQGGNRMMQLRHFDEVRQPDVQASLKIILANEKPFLEKMDGIVREYNSEMRAKLFTLKSTGLYLYVLTILAVVAIGLLIFRPAARKLRQTFAQVVEAESETAAANKKLLSVNKSLNETRQKLFEATKQQYEQQIDEQKLRTSYLIAGQEEERKRLSRELHDGLGQMLTAIKLQLEGLEIRLDRLMPNQPDGGMPYTKNLVTLKSLVTQTIQETRTISNNLMPTVLSDFGVVPAIKMLAEHDRNEAVDVTFETNIPAHGPRLDKNIEIMLYRVTQEAVSNAVRHANPSHIHIELKERAKSLHLVVSDDGQGFRVSSKIPGHEMPEPDQESSGINSTVQRPPSQGLHNIQERTKLVNGKLKLSSTPGKGTTLSIKIPYHTSQFATKLAQHDTH